MKKLLKLTALIISLVLALSCVSCSHGGGKNDEDADFPSKGALKSLKAVEGVPQVYTAEFEGDYFLEEAIGANIKTAAELLGYLRNHVRTWEAEESTNPIKINVQGAACSSIVAKRKNTDGTVDGYIYGRNFDWHPGASLILHTKPSNGFESVSTCFLEFVSMNPDWAPNNKTDNNLLALSCIYVPMDGMNEKGLYIANLQNDTDPVMPADGETSKKYVQTTVAIRYILDNFDTVDKAVNWLKTINMCPVYAEIKSFDPDTGKMEHEFPDYHFAIADNTGKSVVVEWVNGEVKVVNSKIVTNNHLATYDPLHDMGICDTDQDGNIDDADLTVIEENNLYPGSSSESRFIRLWKKHNDEMTAKEIQEALEDVQQSNSVWSAIFEPSEKRVTYYFRKANVFEGVQIPADVHNHEDPLYPAYREAKDHPMNYKKAVVVQF